MEWMSYLFYPLVLKVHLYGGPLAVAALLGFLALVVKVLLAGIFDGIAGVREAWS